MEKKYREGIENEAVGPVLKRAHELAGDFLREAEGNLPRLCFEFALIRLELDEFRGLSGVHVDRPVSEKLVMEEFPSLVERRAIMLRLSATKYSNEETAKDGTCHEDALSVNRERYLAYRLAACQVRDEINDGKFAKN